MDEREGRNRDDPSYPPDHLLIVDDDEDQVETIKQVFWLQNRYLRITVAENARICLDRLRQDRFSAILLDYSLPGMDGLEALGEIRQRTRDVPIVMMTGRGDESIAVEAMKRGAFDYVVKKIGYQRLLPPIVLRAVEQFQLKNRLAQSEERYRRLVECASDGVCLLDLEGKIVMINPRVETLSGHRGDDLMGKALVEFIPREDRLLYEKLFKEVIHGVRARSELRILNQDGAARWISVSGGSLNENGSVSGAIFILQDISHQKEAESALLQKNKELSLLLEAGRTLASHHDLEKILGIFAEQVSRAVVTTLVRIFLVEGEVLVVKAVHPIRRFEWEPGLGDEFRLDQLPQVRDLLSAKQSTVLFPQVLQGLQTNDLQRRFLAGDLAGIQSVAIIPLINRGDLLGVIVLGESRKWERNPITDGQITLCEAIAKQAAVAVENARLIGALKKANRDIIGALGEALETKDLATKGHSDRTVTLALAVARKMGLSEKDQEWTEYTAILHDIGKIGIPESILNKPAHLTEEEFEIMKRHPDLGSEMVSKIAFLKPIAPFVRADHERWDGKGYPQGLAGEKIPLIARIVAVVDAYDAMTSDRIYRKAPGRAYALEELQRCSGSQFDPQVVSALSEVLAHEKETSVGGEGNARKGRAP